MEELIVNQFVELGIVGIMLLGAVVLFVKFYIEDRNQSKADKEQIQVNMEHYRQESKEQRDMFMIAIDKFHNQMDKFGDALNANSTQIQILNKNLNDMECKVDNIQQELSTIKTVPTK